MDELHPKAIGLKLHRITKAGVLLACETVIFTRGRPAVAKALLRARISGRVEIEGHIDDHFADVITDESGSWEQTIALDAKSYGALKNKWMRCKLEPYL